MQPQKETWINDVMRSLQGMHAAEANPFLATRIQAKIEGMQAIPSSVSPKLVWAFASVFLVLLMANIYMLEHKKSNRTTANVGIQTLMNEFNMNNNDIYSTHNTEN